MKRTKYISFLIALVILSCQHPTAVVEKEEINPVQEQFIEIATQYCDSVNHIYNDILKNELYVKYQAIMTYFFDSLAVDNWTFYLSDLRSHDAVYDNVNFKEIEFKLQNGDYFVEPHIVFNATYLVSIDSLDTDGTYNTLRNICNNERVDFSGLVIKRENGYYAGAEYSIDEERRTLTSPRFLILISSVKERDKIEFMPTERRK